MQIIPEGCGPETAHTPKTRHPNTSAKVRDGEVETYPPDPRVVALVGLAMDQAHQITQCPGCDGPCVHKKKGPGIRCLRCGQYWHQSSWAKITRCNRCKQPLDANRRTRCLRCAKTLMNLHKRRPYAA